MCKPKSKYDNTPMATAIAEAIHSERNRKILHAVLIDGWSYEQAAEAANRTPRQVGYVISKEVPRLEEWLSENFIKS